MLSGRVGHSFWLSPARASTAYSQSQMMTLPAHGPAWATGRPTHHDLWGPSLVPSSQIGAAVHWLGQSARVAENRVECQ